MKFVIMLTIALFTGVSMLALAATDAAKAKVGEAAPGFSLQDVNGKTVSLDDYKDKIVVLEWFNNECSFVVKHYREGHMNKLAAKYAEKGVEWVLIDSTNFHNADHNKKAAGKWSINRKILGDADGKVGLVYGATNTPQMFVINKGTIVYAGAIDSKPSSNTSDISSAKNYVAQALDEVLAGKTVSEPIIRAYGCSVKYK